MQIGGGVLINNLDWTGLDFTGLGGGSGQGLGGRRGGEQGLQGPGTVVHETVNNQSLRPEIKGKYPLMTDH